MIKTMQSVEAVVLIENKEFLISIICCNFIMGEGGIYAGNGESGEKENNGTTTFIHSQLSELIWV